MEGHWLVRKLSSVLSLLSFGSRWGFLCRLVRLKVQTHGSPVPVGYSTALTSPADTSRLESSLLGFTLQAAPLLPTLTPFPFPGHDSRLCADPSSTPRQGGTVHTLNFLSSYYLNY